MIYLSKVTKSYEKSSAILNDISLKINKGEFVFLSGASGAGKSTLLKLIYGGEKITSGELVIGGRNFSSIGKDEVSALRREIGCVFQDYRLLPRRTVLENVELVLEIQGLEAKERRKRSHEILRYLELEDRINSYPQSLSGGEQQRVAMARALVSHPTLILADEPTGNLDHGISDKIFELLINVNRMAGITVFVASHDIDRIERLNCRTIILKQGSIAADLERPRGRMRALLETRGRFGG